MRFESCDEYAPLLFTFAADDTMKLMSVLDEKREELEHYEFRMGVARGRLAVALDSLTDALTMVGQHGVYCQSARQVGKPAMDIQIVMKGITDAKELIASVMEEIRKEKDESPQRH
jgi:hypothetical protein